MLRSELKIGQPVSFWYNERLRTEDVLTINEQSSGVHVQLYPSYTSLSPDRLFASPGDAQRFKALAEMQQAQEIIDKAAKRWSEALPLPVIPAELSDAASANMPLKAAA